MEHFIIPENYQPALSLHDTQVGIKTVKDFFQKTLSDRLNLLRVSAPLFVDPSSGLNDNLNGVERPVTFDIKESPDQKAEIVHCKMETLCTEKVWFCTWRRTVYRYGCHPS